MSVLTVQDVSPFEFQTFQGYLKIWKGIFGKRFKMILLLKKQESHSSKLEFFLELAM